MRIVSYRGPHEPGGVSSALTRIFETHVADGDWWFVADGAISRKTSQSDSLDAFEVCNQLRSGHYQYCNNFLWPVLHDLPQYAHYSPHERLCYHGFNSAFAHNLNAQPDETFVNDYQFALLPALVQHSATVFWHIPWPAKVAHRHVPFIRELALALLNCRVVGFHTDEYVSNFLRFVAVSLPQYVIDRQMKIIYGPVGHRVNSREGNGRHGSPSATVVKAAPLGINAQYWKTLANNGPYAQATVDRSIGNRLIEDRMTVDLSDGDPCILSVDRADYTKGVIERLEAIERFFQLHPQWRERVQFRQIVTRSRNGLPEFDRYFEQCAQMVAAINARLSFNGWSPISWQTSPVEPAELAVLYRSAAVMLVNPVRDGLNLTAKEYIACQGDRPGVLALSAGAGVASELGRYVVAINPGDKDDFANAIARCLTMSEFEKHAKMSMLKAKLLENSLSGWWASMQISDSHVVPPSAAINTACG